MLQLVLKPVVGYIIGRFVELLPPSIWPTCRLNKLNMPLPIWRPRHPRSAWRNLNKPSASGGAAGGSKLV